MHGLLPAFALPAALLVAQAAKRARKGSRALARRAPGAIRTLDVWRPPDWQGRADWGQKASLWWGPSERLEDAESVTEVIGTTVSEYSSLAGYVDDLDLQTSWSRQTVEVTDEDLGGRAPAPRVVAALGSERISQGPTNERTLRHLPDYFPTGRRARGRLGSAWGGGVSADDAIEAWLRDEPFSRSSCPVSTNGYVLKSYNMVIGQTVSIKGQREKVVWDTPASHTTRTHIMKAKRAGAILRSPVDRTALTLAGPVTTVLEPPPKSPTAKDLQHEEDQRWRRRGPWDLDHSLLADSECPHGFTIRNVETGKTKCIPFRSRSNAYEKAVHECAERNRKIAQKREGTGSMARKKWSKGIQLRAGKLGGPGFTTKSWAERKAILDAGVRKYGYRSMLGSILFLENIKAGKTGVGRMVGAGKTAAVGQNLAHDHRYLVRTYGAATTGRRRPLDLDALVRSVRRVA
jgi:hypothetical protein